MYCDSPNFEEKGTRDAFIPYAPERYTQDEALVRVHSFCEDMAQRRSLRHFSDEPTDPQLVKTAIEAACTAPSGANKQPWSYCLVADPMLKKRIREMAEEEEFKSYNGRMSEQWLKDLSPFGTDHNKPFIETAPFLIVVFKRPYELSNGEKIANYYVNESVGISVGILLSALQMAGLSTLTHTPSPMNFLCELLERPSNERPYLLIPVGYPSSDAQVPNISRKPIHQVLTEY